MRIQAVTVLSVVCLCAGCGPRLSPAERLVNQASLKISQGNRTDAEPMLKQAIAMNPNLAWAHYNLATCLHARRAFDDAVASYRRALELFPVGQRWARSACLYGIAAALDDKNEFAKAKQAYEAYLQFAADVPEESNGVVVARGRMEILERALHLGVVAGKPLRAPLAPASAPAAQAPEASPPAGPAPAKTGESSKGGGEAKPAPAKTGESSKGGGEAKPAPTDPTPAPAPVTPKKPQTPAKK